MKKILLSLLLAGTVQNSFAMGSCGGGGQAAESGFRLEGQVPVVFRDGLVVYLDLQRLKALNSGLLQGILFTADGLSGIGEVSEGNPFAMTRFENLAAFEKFETALKLPLQGEIADMVDFFKKADFLGINTDYHLKGLLARDKAQFFKLCLALLAENPGFVLNMQRVYPEILCHAVRTEDPDFAKMLIDAGADVNVKINWGWTPLFLAASNSQIEIAQLLITAGADVNSRDPDGTTLLMIAARNGHTEIARLFIAECVDVNARNNCHNTALMMALENGYIGTAQLLIAAHADVDASDSDGHTALMFAAYTGRTEIAQLLIAAHADVNASDNNGGTALMFAAENGYIGTAQLLIAAAGADVNDTNNQGMTALMWAAETGHTEIVRLLIAAGADVNVKDRYGRTALMLLARWNSTEIAQLLRDAGAS